MSITVERAIEVASQFAGANESAALAVVDAEAMVRKGSPTLALAWALCSLEHSVGRNHPAALTVARAVASSDHPLARTTSILYGLESIEVAA